MNRRTQVLIAMVTAVAVLLTGAWALWQRKEVPQQSTLPVGPTAEVALVATESTPAGVEATTGFRLTSQRALDLDQVQKRLTVHPAVDLRIEQVGTGGREFQVLPARALDANRVYRFRLAAAAGAGRTYQWSFQTRAEFRVLGTLPRHQGQGVPQNSGIEITFTHADYPDLTPFFTISPQVAGRFERHKQTAVFVPSEPLAPGTVYTVTLRKGLKQTAGPGELKADYTFAFETAGKEETGGGAHFSVPTLQEFALADSPFFQISYFDRKKNTPPPIDVTVYRYPDAAGFIAAAAKADQVPTWASFAKANQQIDTAGLDQVAAFQTEAKQYPNIGGEMLTFPAPLPAGYYMAVFKADQLVRGSLFQVTDLSSYVAVTTTQTLVWLNDLASGSPAAGTKVKLQGGPETTANQDGVAVLPTPDSAASLREPTGVYLHARAPNGQEAVIAVGPGYSYWGYWDSRELAAQYWKYLYLDRELYKPADQVNLWGIVRPREPGAKPVTAVTAEVVRSDYGSYGDRPLVLASATIPVTDSTFTGTLALPNLRPGSYQLVVRLGEQYLTERWFEVQTYTKPAYQLKLTPDRRAIFLGETARLKVSAAFFEGTPVPDLRLSYNVSGTAGLVTTDSAGEAEIPFRPDGTDKGYYGNYGGPNTAWFQVSADLPEVGPIHAQATMMVFPRNVTYQPTVAVEQGRATVSAQVDHITLEGINAGGSAWEYKGGAAAGRPVKGQLIEQNWVREDAGEYYDFIQKTVQRAYRYRAEHAEVATFTATTDAAGRFSHSLTVDPEKSYEVRLQVQDTAGGWVDQSLWFTGKQYAGYRDSFYRYYHLDSGQKHQWGLGEEISLVFKENQAPLPDRPKGYLFFTARQGLGTIRVQDRPGFTTALRELDLPNTNVKAVFFDGRVYREARERALDFDPAERELQVTITADKPEYRPGDTVGLALRVTDREGRPVKAQVNLNLVDEALFALQEQYVNLLGSLYGEQIAAGILRTRSSHFVPEPGSFAEKGGDGGGARKDFQDAIYFATVATDAQGLAVASFKVPDNLTSWRVTWHALAPSTMSAAHGTTAIPVRLPFFVDPVLSDSYLAGDQPVLTVRSYGSALRAGQAVQYRVRVTAPDGTVTDREVPGSAFAPIAVPLPSLQAGSYTIRVDAVADAMTDAAQRQVTVVESFLRQNMVELYTLRDGLQLQSPGSGVTLLTFTDYERSRYLRLLEQLRWQWGNRFEQKLARTVAQTMLSEHFGAPVGQPAPELNTHAYQTQAGSVAILPYSDGDLKLSVLAADLAPERFDRGALQLYFAKLLDDPGAGREQAILALYGLAALEQPVLLEARALLTQTDLTFTEQLYLALALAELGDHEGARPLYYKLLQAHSEQVGTALRIKAGTDQDELLSATALAGMLAAKLGEPHAPAMAEYLTENPTKEVLVLLEAAIMLRDGLPNLGAEPAAFTYELSGRSQQVELKPGQPFRLAVPAAALGTLKFREVRGQVGLAAGYEAPLAAADLKQQSGFALTRTYQSDGRSTTQFTPGKLVKVTLRYTIPATAPGGAYEVTDHLPAGLRLVERPWQYGQEAGRNWQWPAEVSGQRVTFYTSGDGRPIEYYARVTGTGTFTAQEPVLQHQKSGLIYGHGEPVAVQIP